MKFFLLSGTYVISRLMMMMRRRSQDSELALFSYGIGDESVLYWWFCAVRIFGRSKSCLYRTWSAKSSRTFRIRCPRDGMRNVRCFFIYDMYMKMRSKTWYAKCSRRIFRIPCLQKNFFQFFFENVFYIMKKNDVFWKFFFFTSNHPYFCLFIPKIVFWHARAERVILSTRTWW